MHHPPESPAVCRSCRGEAPAGCARCEACQVTFESWLRGDSPVTYTPRRDGVWRDVHVPLKSGGG